MFHPHAPNHLRPVAQSALTWNAAWIWFIGECWSVNFSGLARKHFSLAQPARRAILHITASTDYLLRIDGTYIGRGPMPCDPWYQSYDSYDVTSLLSQGDHVLAIVCHNTGIGTHRQHRGRGGLLVQVEIETQEGLVTIGTDASWRLSRASGWSQRAPRQFWPADFVELFDARLQPVGWDRPGYDDADWESPHLYGVHPTHPWHHLLARDLPLLRETPLSISSLQKGTCTLQGVHAVRLEQPGLYAVQTAFYSERPCTARVHIECDDAFKLLVNGNVEIQQQYDENFARTRMWRSKDEYEQVHFGMGPIGFRKELELEAGWNSLQVVIDQGPGGWGFVLAWCNATSGEQLLLRSAADELHGEQWSVVGPYESSGLNDNLSPEQLDRFAHAETRWFVPPFDYAGGVTDFATLMRYEQRHAPDVLPPTQPFKLSTGEFCIIDIGRVQVTYPAFVFRADQDDATLDIGYSQLAYPDHSIHFSNRERMKYVDRIILPLRRAVSWEPLQRRTGRYIHLSCRAGSVTIEQIALRAVGYPVERQAAFRCSDDTLNRIWEVSVHTTALLMQHGYQDCLKREQDTFNTSSFNYTSRAAALCFGDTALARKTLRLGAQLQNESGWFDSHGFSGLNSDEPTECLWWIVWLRDHFWIAGDRALVAELFEPVEDVLRFFAKMSNQYGLLDVKNWHVFRPGQSIYVDDAVTYDAPPTIEFYNGYSEGETSGLNMLYYAALDAAAALALQLDETERAAFYQRKAARVRQALDTRLWDVERAWYADWREPGGALSVSGHPVMQITAAYFGIADEARTQQVLQFLNEYPGLPDEAKLNYPLYTFGYYFYWLECLFRNGQAAQAIELMRRVHGRWLTALPGGATTFGEFFRLADVAGGKTLTEEYEVHAYGASAHLHFYTNILGVRPAAPGFAHIALAPQPGGLQWAQGTVQTPQGLVLVSWELQADDFRLDVQLPAELPYTLHLPAEAKRVRVRVNGREVELER